MKHILAVAVGLAIIFGFMAFKPTVRVETPVGSLAVCTPTTEVVTVGHQETKTVLAAGARSWAIIQQPLNATNTVSLSIGGTAVAGQGYIIYPTITGSTTDHLKLGFATDLPTSAAVTARTSTGSTTLNVITCR